VSQISGQKNAKGTTSLIRHLQLHTEAVLTV
jgi:hypothetical protein